MLEWDSQRIATQAFEAIRGDKEPEAVANAWRRMATVSWSTTAVVTMMGIDDNQSAILSRNHETAE
jgi:hypothetical protein